MMNGHQKFLKIIGPLCIVASKKYSTKLILKAVSKACELTFLFFI